MNRANIQGGETITVNPAFKEMLRRWKEDKAASNNNVESNAATSQVGGQRAKVSRSLYTIDGRIKPRKADPIKDKQTIEDIKQRLLLTGRYGWRNYLIYVVGINVGRRVGDILKLKVGDVVGNNWVLKDEIVHVEEKTGKVVEFYFNESVKAAIAEYIDSQDDLLLSDYLFQSQKGGGRLSTRSYWRILQGVQKDLQLDEHLSTHSMRKTFGYHKYQEFKERTIEGGFDVVDMLQDAYGHSDRKQTMTYIGIGKENKRLLYCDTAL